MTSNGDSLLLQVVVKTIATGARVIIKSNYGYEIDEVKVMGNDNFIVGHTSDTLIIAELSSNRTSEVRLIVGHR